MGWEKVSLAKSIKNRSFRLHWHKNNRKGGFTLIEVLIVVLVIGIITGLALGNYSGVIQDTRTKSATDRIEVFFRSCKDKARLRNLDITILYNEKAECLTLQNSVSTALRVPELEPSSVPKRIEINKQGKAFLLGKEINSLELYLRALDGKTTPITIKL